MASLYKNRNSPQWNSRQTEGHQPANLAMNLEHFWSKLEAKTMKTFLHVKTHPSLTAN